MSRGFMTGHAEGVPSLLLTDNAVNECLIGGHLIVTVEVNPQVEEIIVGD
eukprot:CAMPEP_0184663096 /NCGR_PEP_ID=MMETSP0308-20130426/46561_1 /TAXON_ID=38269 /ORGANISM="Gloeochaete witrockiana, Strain SAG 46.84" /LENGTH=49 /DNA_ID=CAMNT_0027105595 /DNA_START=163 /DNA_END=312 /DNA_ORIENTATION=+